MKKLRLITLCSIILTVVYAPGALACDDTDINAVDAIDGVFPPFGGTIVASISGTQDESWMVFEALAGDVITITYSSSNDGGSEGMISATLLETTNGVVEVGDALNILDWNPNNFGATGPDFEVVSSDNNSDGNNSWSQSGTHTQVVTISETGHYALVTAICNALDDGEAPPTTITVSIVGNSPIPVPTLSFWAMLGLAGLLGLTGFVLVNRS